MYPVPDGPLFPLKASVTWSIEPAVKGISIDKTGKISVDADVPHGTTATVRGDVENGRRKLSRKIYVFHPDMNPLIGQWHVDTARGVWRITGNAGQSAGFGYTLGLSLSASVGAVGEVTGNVIRQEFWAGQKHIRGQFSGTYELDLKTAKIKLTSYSGPKSRYRTGAIF